MFIDGIVLESLAFLKGAWEDAILLREERVRDPISEELLGSMGKARQVEFVDFVIFSFVT